MLWFGSSALTLFTTGDHIIIVRVDYKGTHSGWDDRFDKWYLGKSLSKHQVHRFLWTVMIENTV